MALNSINTNIAAYSAQGNIGKASNSASASIARLSSGNRITQASDDVAALSIGTSLRTGVTTLKTALLNANQGSSLLQVADGALSQLSEILQRQKAIATQASSGQLGDAERGYLNQEFQSLSAEIDRISGSTNFNGVKLINGGLGTTTVLANSTALAALYTPVTSTGNTALAAPVVASSQAIQAFNRDTGASLLGTAAGNIQLVDSGSTALTNAAFLDVNQAVVGQFESFKFSNVTYGTAAAGSATLTARINGVDFSGIATGNTANVILRNGNTYLQVTATAGNLNFLNAGTTAVSEQAIETQFRPVTFMKTSVVSGVSMENTALEGATGLAGLGVAATRLTSNNAVISNFQYAGNTGAANGNTITVQINGKTFTASGVEDLRDSANGKIVFAADDLQTFVIDMTNQTTAITNIRTSLTDRAAFINALNIGFSKAGSGLDFQVGSTSADSLKVSLASANTTSLYGGQALTVATAVGAGIAGAALDIAISKVTSLRADVGAIQSRFNYASANLETSIQNQDAARGTLLDTDVSAESTAYATAQVQLQAGIAVLAQANQLPQNLLKLIS